MLNISYGGLNPAMAGPQAHLYAPKYNADEDSTLYTITLCLM